MDYQQEFSNLIKKTKIVGDKDVYFAQVGAGNEIGIITSNTIKTYSPDNNWVVFNYANNDTYFTREAEGVAVGTFTIEIIGKDADMLAMKFKALLTTNEMLTYISRRGLRFFNTDVSAQEGNILFNNVWYRRRIMEFKFNSKVKFEIKDNYVDNVELEFIKEV